jgi:predicted aldo/keto reductase-like oxidoreductase
MRMNRREFLACGTAVVTALGTQNRLWSATARHANDVLYLGPDKIKVTRMAIGLGTNAGHVQRELGLQGVADYLHFAFDQGQFFWDTADAYKTHPHVKQALKVVPRDKVTILTKTDVHTAAEMKRDLDRYRQELGTDYIDIVLLHGVWSPTWPEDLKGVMDVLSEAKEKGIIRTHGASVHSLEALKLAAKTPWCRVQLQAINPAGIRMDATDPAIVIAAMRQSKAAGVGVIGMKILGEGRLVNRADEALRFALGIDCLDCFTIGAGNRDQLADLIKRVPANSRVA